jgi:hypothetical protein
VHPPGVDDGRFGPPPSDLPPQPTPEAGGRSTFAKLRLVILLVFFAGVAFQYLRVRQAESWTPDWEGGREHVALRILVPTDLDEDEAAAVEKLKEYAFMGDDLTSFSALGDWMKQEQARYRPVGTTSPVAFEILGPFPMTELPPPPPRAGEELSFFDRYKRTTAFLDYFAGIKEAHPADPVNSIFVIFYRPQDVPYLDKVHSVADRRSRSGFVFARLDDAGIEAAVINTAHELLHLFGASDKYNGKTCDYPEGFVEPFSEPRYPQSYAEVMAQGIPLGEGEKEASLNLFGQMRVGVHTAFEIGWIDQARRDRYYNGDVSAGPKLE